MEFLISKLISKENQEKHFSFFKENKTMNFESENDFKKITKRISFINSGFNLNEDNNSEKINKEFKC